MAGYPPLRHQGGRSEAARRNPIVSLYGPVISITSPPSDDLPQPRVVIYNLKHAKLQVFSLLHRRGTSMIKIDCRPLPSLKNAIIIKSLQSPTALIGTKVHRTRALILTASSSTLGLTVLARTEVLGPTVHVVGHLFGVDLKRQLSRALPSRIDLDTTTLTTPLFTFTTGNGQTVKRLRLFGLA